MKIGMTTGSLDIRKLENESLLQLYVGGELSATDRTEFEAQLRSDLSLQAQLLEARSLRDEADLALATLDRLDPIVLSDSSQRAVLRVFRQQMVEIAARPKPAVKVHRISKLAWTSIAAAAAVVIFCVSILSSSVRDHLAPKANFGLPDSVATDDHPISPIPSEESARPSQVALGPLDRSSQKIENLEWLVHDDLRDAWH